MKGWRVMGTFFLYTIMSAGNLAAGKCNSLITIMGVETEMASQAKDELKFPVNKEIRHFWLSLLKFALFL